MNQAEINFIGIGAQKAGTSWLYNNLHKLPDFDLLPIKELHYFDRDTRYPSPNKLSETKLYRRLLSRTWTKRFVKEIFTALSKRDFNRVKWAIKFSLANYDDAWYLSLFSDLNGIKGEFTPSYSILEVEDIQRMYALAPGEKLLFILRNPNQRVWSAYRYSKGKDKDFSFNETTSDILKYMYAEGQLKRSDYLSTLANYTKIYPEEQILICFYDAINDCPEKLLREVVQFLAGSRKMWRSFAIIPKE
jgi:hypothetical protein